MNKCEIKKKSLSGFYKKIDLDDSGKIISDSGWVPNSIVNEYALVMAQLFENLSEFKSDTPIMCIGTDGTPVTSIQSGLIAEGFRVKTEVSKSIYEEGQGMFESEGLINSVDVTGIFEKGIECDIKEIGLMWGKDADPNVLDSGLLFSRKVITSGWHKEPDVRSIFVYRLIFREV